MFDKKKRPVIRKISSTLSHSLFTRLNLQRRLGSPNLKRYQELVCIAKELSLHCVRLWKKWVLFLSFRAGREPGGKKGTVKKNNTYEHLLIHTVKSAGIFSFCCISQKKARTFLQRCSEYVQNHLVSCSQSRTLEGHPYHWPWLVTREFRTAPA